MPQPTDNGQKAQKPRRHSRVGKSKDQAPIDKANLARKALKGKK